jgi:molybdate transport system ATP-binding protein
MTDLTCRFRLRRGGFLLDVDFLAPGRGVTAVFGPSGSGKTTLLRCVAGLERSPEGFLSLGEEVWQDEARGVFLPTHRRPVGYVFQEAALFSHLSVRGNLEYGLARTPAADRRVGFDEAVAWLGAGPLLDRRPDHLSGGERQRAAIARALLTSPRLLLMDEPLASLDAASRAEILPYLERLHAELSIPVLYVSHSQAEVLRLADHLVLLEAGRVRAAGPLGEIATRLDLLPWAPEEEPGTLIEALASGYDEDWGLARLDFPGGSLLLPSQPLLPGSRRRVRILARDVALSLERPERTSVLNVVPAKILEIAEGGSAQALVRLDAGGTVLLARITRKSLHLLGLRPGLEVYALIKAVALVG